MKPNLVTELTDSELKRVLDTLEPAERSFIRELYTQGAKPREIATVLELFHHFPGARLAS